MTNDTRNVLIILGFYFFALYGVIRMFLDVLSFAVGMSEIFVR